MRRAEIAKVTDVVGNYAHQPDDDATIDADGGVVFLADLLPAVDRCDVRGPRGRFRITVEFWPEEKL